MSAGPWADELEELQTITAGHDSNLKHDDGRLRVWLSRLGLEDGEPFARTVYVEELKPGGWWLVGYFDGDERDPHPLGTLGDAWNATGRAVEEQRKGTYRSYSDRLHALGLGVAL